MWVSELDKLPVDGGEMGLSNTNHGKGSVRSPHLPPVKLQKVVINGPMESQAMCLSR